MPANNESVYAEDKNGALSETSSGDANKILKGLYVTQSADITDDDDGYVFTGFKARYDAIASKFMSYGFPAGSASRSLSEAVNIDKPAAGFPVNDELDGEDFCMMVQATCKGRPVESLSSFSANYSMTGSKLSSDVFSTLDCALRETDPYSDTQAAPGASEAGDGNVENPADYINDPYLYYKMTRGYDPEDLEKLIDEY